MLSNRFHKGKVYKITIITVCYRAEKTIADTLQSVLSQKDAAFEYIIKDGASDDRTNAIIRSFQDGFPEKNIAFRHLISRDQGIYDAMNEAAAQAKGEYLLFLNADDRLYDNRVIFRAESFLNEKKACDVLYGDTLMEDGTEVHLFKADMSLIRRRMPFAHQSCILRKAVFCEEYYKTLYKICADYDLILTLYQKGAWFCYLNEIISVYSLGGISSTQFVPKMREHLKILEDHGLIRRYSVFKCIRLLEAEVKTMMMACCPAWLLCRFKKIYKRAFKKYREIK